MKRAITQGMWCKDEDGRVGIAQLDDVHGKDGKPVFDAQGFKTKESTFHLVDANGNTTLVVWRAWDGLVQATYNDIPEPRREGLSRDHAASRLGYV